MTNTDFDYNGDLPEGDYELYTSPPQRKPIGYAGITIWSGDVTVGKGFTETEMKFVDQGPRILIERVVSQLLDELAAHGIKEQP